MYIQWSLNELCKTMDTLHEYARIMLYINYLCVYHISTIFDIFIKTTPIDVPTTDYYTCIHVYMYAHEHLISKVFVKLRPSVEF